MNNISLRDYFAGQALAGLMQLKETPSTLAQVAYNYADALIAERTRQYGKEEKKTAQPTNPFKVWKTITLGEYKSPKEYREALKKADNNIGSWADDILNKITVSKKKETVDLVKITVEELGFNSDATTKKIYDKALSMGLELCPNEVGPALRLMYQNQLSGEFIFIAMNPITDSDGDPHVFRLGRNGDGLWLGGNWTSPGNEWGPDYEFMFRLRKSES